MELVDKHTLDRALMLSGQHLQLEGYAPPHRIARGESALIARGLVPRTTTRDVDPVALRDLLG